LKAINPPKPSTWDYSQKLMNSTMSSPAMIQETTGSSWQAGVVCQNDGDALVNAWCDSESDDLLDTATSAYHKCISHENFTNELLLTDHSPFNVFGSDVKNHASETIEELKTLTNDKVSMLYHTTNKIAKFGTESMVTQSFFMVNNIDKKCFDVVEVFSNSKPMDGGKKFPGDFEASQNWVDVLGESEKYSVRSNYGPEFNSLQENNFSFLSKYYAKAAQFIYFQVNF